MKKLLIIGNPIEHSLSPKLHNYWFKKNNINAIYEKIAPKENEIKDVIENVRKGEIYGMNVTVPYKQKVIPFLDDMSSLAKDTGSVNTIFKKDGKIIGENTDVSGFEISLKDSKYSFKNKIVLILGAGGVVPSIIKALKNLEVGKIYLSNRTQSKAEDLKKIFIDIEIIKWGEFINFDAIINATSLGLHQEENIEIDFNIIGKDKFFYDVIYNPPITNFLNKAKRYGHKTQNGKMMFLYQAQKAFNIWHNIIPKINDKLINFLYND